MFSTPRLSQEWPKQKLSVSVSTMIISNGGGACAIKNNYYLSQSVYYGWEFSLPGKYIYVVVVEMVREKVSYPFQRIKDDARRARRLYVQWVGSDVRNNPKFTSPLQQTHLQLQTTNGRRR